MSPRNEKLSSMLSPQIERPSVEPAEPSLVDSLETVVDHFSPPSNINIPSSLSSSASSTPRHNQNHQQSLPQDSRRFDMSGGVEVTDVVVNNESKEYFGIVMPVDIFSFLYGALVATGGIIGYVKAGSVPSLVAGLGFGGIIGIGAVMTTMNPNNYWLTYAASGVLGGMFSYRFIKSGKVFPAAVVAALSIAFFARYSYMTYDRYVHRKTS